MQTIFSNRLIFEMLDTPFMTEKVQVGQQLALIN